MIHTQGVIENRVIAEIVPNLVFLWRDEPAIKRRRSTGFAPARRPIARGLGMAHPDHLIGWHQAQGDRRVILHLLDLAMSQSAFGVDDQLQPLP